MRFFAAVLFATAVLSSQPALSADGKKHLPGIFLGYTDTDYGTDFTWGIEYEYKFDQEWGIGAVYEKTKDGHKGDGVTVKLASVFYHPTKNIRFGAGLGEEKIGGYHPHTETLYRLSASYDFHVGDFGIAPTVAVDFVDGKKAYVLGVAIIRPF